MSYSRNVLNETIYGTAGYIAFSKQRERNPLHFVYWCGGAKRGALILERSYVE